MHAAHIHLLSLKSHVTISGSKCSIRSKKQTTTSANIHLDCFLAMLIDMVNYTKWLSCSGADFILSKTYRIQNWTNQLRVKWHIWCNKAPPPLFKIKFPYLRAPAVDRESPNAVQNHSASSFRPEVRGRAYTVLIELLCLYTLFSFIKYELFLHGFWSD